MRARPATSATRSPRPAAKWPNASSAGASNTARCARPNIEASQPSPLNKELWKGAKDVRNGLCSKTAFAVERCARLG